MGERTVVGPAELISMLDRSVQTGRIEEITERIRLQLSDLFGSESLRLPDPLCAPREECYARRLLHRSEQLGYTAVVMTWGPGQTTPLHDHAGIWCVEGVVRGEMKVTRYQVAERNGERFRFDEVEQVRAGVGSSGALIPPFEHHVLANALDDRPSITLHVYGGEMDHCCIYRPRDDGWHDRVQKTLVYD